MSIERHETYKTFAGFKYHLNVPDEWILNELPRTGRDCWNCVGNREQEDTNGFAMWRGIILGYCANCAHVYGGERCKGFVGFGVEDIDNRFESAHSVYLDTIDFESFGDLAENEEDTIENRVKYLKEQSREDENYDGEEEEQDYYENEEDDFGMCLHIGCGKASVSYSAYCKCHFNMYDK